MEQRASDVSRNARKLLALYLRSLQRRPIATKCCTSALIGASGNLFTQTMIHGKSASDIEVRPHRFNVITVSVLLFKLSQSIFSIFFFYHLSSCEAYLLSRHQTSSRRRSLTFGSKHWIVSQIRTFSESKRGNSLQSLRLTRLQQKIFGEQYDICWCSSNQ